MLIRHIYVSRSHKPLPLDLKDVLASARKNNPALGITGALCFLDGVYLQYLEGEALRIDDLYATIKKDPRHYAPATLHRAPIEERAFSHWSMALMTWDEESKAVFRSFTPGTRLDLYAVDPATVAPLFLALARTQNWMSVA